MFIQHIGATGLQNITDGDESYISCVEFTVYGFTGSMIPQCVQMTDGPTVGLLAAAPNYFNAGYVNANTGVSYAAGTAITADGRYIIDTTGAKFALNVTDAGDSDFYVYGKPLAGPAPSFAATSGGGAVTVADGANVVEGSTTDAAVGDATGTINAHLRQIAKVITAGVEIANDSGNPLPVSGTGSDNSTNSTAKLPVLIGVAQTGAPTITAGRQVPAYVDQVTGGVFIYDVTPVTAAIPTRVGTPVANDWTYAAASGGITNTTGVTVKAAAGASIKNYVSGLQLFNSGAAGTDVQLRSGASGTVIWRGYVGATSASVSIVFPTPLQTAANTLLEVGLSSGTTVAVYVNVQGFTAA